MRILFYLGVLFLGLAACKPNTATTPPSDDTAEKVDRTQLLSSIESIENEFKKAEKVDMDPTKALQLIEKTLIFVESFPQDSLSPELLFRTAQVARAIKKYGRAIQMFGKVHREYPDNERSPTALFLQAFIFENHLNDKEQAQKYYLHFMDKYPDNKLAVQVEQILKVIDKSPEELVKEFQQKNKQ